MSTRPHGVTLSGDTSGIIGSIYSLSPPEPEVGEINTTHYDITDNAHRYESGLIEGGEVEFGVIYSDSIYNILDRDLGVEQIWDISYPDDSTHEFTGFISSIGTEVPDADDDEVMRNTVTIKISGKPVFTAS